MSNLVENNFIFSLVFLTVTVKIVFFAVLKTPLEETQIFIYAFPPLLIHLSFLRILKFVRNEPGRMNSAGLCPWSAASCSKGLYGCNVRKIWCIVN